MTPTLYDVRPSAPTIHPLVATGRAMHLFAWTRPLPSAGGRPLPCPSAAAGTQGVPRRRNAPRRNEFPPRRCAWRAAAAAVAWAILPSFPALSRLLTVTDKMGVRALNRRWCWLRQPHYRGWSDLGRVMLASCSPFTASVLAPPRPCAAQHCADAVLPRSPASWSRVFAVYARG